VKVAGRARVRLELIIPNCSELQRVNMQPSKTFSPRLIQCAVLAAMLLFAGACRAASLIDPSGTWLTEDGRARVRVEYCGPQQEQVCGYLVWVKQPSDASGRRSIDEQNPDREKRSRPTLGHQMILGLRPNADARFEGSLYNADNGKTYEVSLWRAGPPELRVKGCMLAILCGSQTWTLVTDMASGQLTGPTGSPNGPRPDKEWAKESIGAIAAGARPPAAAISKSK
jgi:uncharacterized protein (DUF2147 family)